MLVLGHIGVTSGILYLLRLLKNRRDFSLAVVGALLPDIIDKPLGLIIFHGFGNGRLIAHTLVFNLLLLTLFAAFRHRMRSRMKSRMRSGHWLIVPLASLMHVLDDETWKEPSILFFPLLGGFPVKNSVSFYERLMRILHAYTEPVIQVSELVGVIAILYIFFLAFPRSGK